MMHRCKEYDKRSTIKSVSVMKDSKQSLMKWATTIYKFAVNLRGISATQLHRVLGVSYKTIWFMVHRIHGTRTVGDLPPLEGSRRVEADETYIG